MKKFNKVFYRTSTALLLLVTMTSSFTTNKASASEQEVVTTTNVTNDQSNIENQENTKEEIAPVEVESEELASEELVPTEILPENEEVPAIEETIEIAEDVLEETTLLDEEEEEVVVVDEMNFSPIIGNPNVEDEAVKIQLSATADEEKQITLTPASTEQKTEDVVEFPLNESSNQKEKTIASAIQPTTVVASATETAQPRTETLVAAANEEVVSNAKLLTAEASILPQTGQSTSSLKMVGMAILALMGGLLLIQRKKRSANN